MATFAAWFEAQAGRGDEVGELAKAWRDAKGARPRASAPSTVTRWMVSEAHDAAELGPKRIEQVMTAALAQYHTGSHQSGPAVPSPPLGPDLQLVPLRIVPGDRHEVPEGAVTMRDHQQPDPAGDDETAGQDTAYPAVAGTVRPDMVFNMIGQLDERLAGLQELVAAVPAIHELLVALIKALVPVIELAGELTASDAKLESMAGEVRDLASQLGYSPIPEGHLVHPDSPAGRMLAADDITPAQERARSVAEQNGWIERASHQAEDEGRMTTPGPHDIYHQQASQPAGLYGPPIPRESWPSPALPPRIEPEPDWARYHDLGEPSDG